MFTFEKGMPNEQLCWCQGKVTEVNNNTNKPNNGTVCWDPMPDSDKYNESHTSNVDLLPTFWNKDKDRAWRLDIDLAVQAMDDNKSDDETED